MTVVRKRTFWQELFHFAPDEEIYYESYFRVIHPEDRDWVNQAVQQALQSGEVLRCDYRIVLPDGSTRWIGSRGQRLVKSTGEPDRMLGLALDITERKQMEDALRKSEEKYRLTFLSISDVIYTIDSDLRISSMTPNIEKILGYKVEELINRPFQDFTFLTPESLEKATCDAMRVLSGEQISASVYEFIAKDGTRIFGEISGSPLIHEGKIIGITSVARDVTERERLETQLREHLAEIEKLKSQLEKENIYLREEIKTELGFGKIIGSSDALQYVLFRAQKVAPTDATVLILGETGVGKGMVAHAIHEMSARRDKPMITVNCAALPANLIESELFGREKGAFTGAHARQAGRFEVADGGTIFLDEIGELPLELQAKLLRVLQDREFERLGSPKTVKVDVRVIASTSRDLKVEMHSGRFREDLYYRLNVFPVSLPPLRTRVEDIPELTMHFIDKYAHKFGRRFETISKDAMQLLQAYHWPGNVRELEHVIERAVITSPEPVFRLVDQLEHEPVKVEEGTLKEFEAMAREHILQVLQKTSWKIEGEGGAAAILGLNPSTLRFRIKKLGITRP